MRSIGSTHSSMIVSLAAFQAAILDHSQASYDDKQANEKLTEFMRAFAADVREFTKETDLPATLRYGTVKS